MDERPGGSLQAIVTDPPFGVREFEPEQREKARSGKGVWRRPSAVGGSARKPAPRFTDMTEAEREAVRAFFARFARSSMRVLVPGAHVIMACSPVLKWLVAVPMVDAGYEVRGELVRLVMTRRGGDRPKGSEAEFPDATVMPRGCYEPWLIFRKPLERGATVAENLRRWGTGALRRRADGRPFMDVVRVPRTPRREREASAHTSLKPQELMRQLAYASLPTGSGTILDPFMGGGSTIAAASALGLDSVGVEIDKQAFDAAVAAIPALSSMAAPGDSDYRR